VENRKTDAILIIINLAIISFFMFGIGKLFFEFEALEEELYAEQLKSIDLTLENEKLVERLENITVEELLGIPEDWRIVAVTATAYAPLDNKSGICADSNPNVTAKPKPGVVAVNPDLIPYYSEMIIIGDGWIEEGVALDTGGKMRQEVYWIDIYKGTYEEAMKFGVQEVIVLFRESK
jgi:3D (Asp-Asp-Asp) domain-containing protein